VLGSDGLTPTGHVPILESGLTEGPIPSVQSRFLGPELRLTSVPDAAWSAPSQTWGMATLVVTFPLNKTGRQEPLLTSGVTGAGDFIYVIYADEHHVRLGFDHWNGGGVISDPIAVDYHEPHEIWISTLPLYPDIAGKSGPPALGQADLERLRSRVRVALDGTTVISSATSAYPSSPYQVTAGTNQIGGSSADPLFSGILHSSGRMNPAAVSW
jgi:hypothetical protein